MAPEHTDNSPELSSDIHFRIFGYEEDDEWVALALEMDLRGYGETFEDAVRDLRELMLMQISFAVQKGHPQTIWKAAEPHYWTQYQDAYRQQVFARLSAVKQDRTGPQVIDVPIPPAHLIASSSHSFYLASDVS